MDGLRLNLTDQEAKSEVRTYEVPPTGAYVCNIVDLTDEYVRPDSPNNAGKPYWNARFVIDQGSKYDGTALYCRIMLFEGAARQIKQLVQAVFPELLEGNELRIPPADKFMGKQVLVVGIRHKEGSNMTRKDKATGKYKVVGKYDRDVFDIAGFKAVDPTGVKKSANDSDLP